MHLDAEARVQTPQRMISQAAALNSTLFQWRDEVRRRRGSLWRFLQLTSLQPFLPLLVRFVPQSTSFVREMSCELAGRAQEHRGR